MSALSIIEQLKLSPRESATYKAEQDAERDYFDGLKPNSARHGAKPGSAWDIWYLRKYQELQNSN